MYPLPLRTDFLRSLELGLYIEEQELCHRLSNAIVMAGSFSPSYARGASLATDCSMQYTTMASRQVQP